MAQDYYSRHKTPVLTEEEIKEKYKESQEEMKEVLEWKKETEANLENQKISPQKRGAAKRAMKKIAWRINTIKGQLIYWDLRIKGESHFKANIEKNEFWASCKEETEKENKKVNLKIPRIMKLDPKQKEANLLKALKKK